MTGDEREQIDEKTDNESEDKPYDREEKIRELLEQDEKRSPWADEFMGF